MANAVVIAVGMTRQDLVAGAQEVASSVRQMSQQIRTHAAEASSGVEALEGSIKRFTKSARSEGRMINFFVRDIVEVTGASKEAKEALAGVLGAGLSFATGNYLLAGIEGVKLAVMAIREISKEAKRELVTLNGQVDAMVAKAAAARGGNADSWFYGEVHGDKPTTEEGKAYQEAMAAYKRIAGTSEAYRETVVKGGFATEEASRKNSTYIHGLEREAKAYEKVQEELGKLQAARDRMARGLRAIEAGGAGPETDWNKGEAAGPQTESSAAKKAEKLAEDLKWARYQGMSTAGLAKQPDIDRGLWMYGGARNPRDVMEENLTKYAGGSADRRMKGAMGDMGPADMNKVTEALKEQNEQYREMARTFSGTLARSASSAFKSMITGAKSVGAAIKDMFSSILDALIDTLMGLAEKWLEKSIENLLVQRATTSATNVATIASDAAVAAAAAYASTAAIPVAGPVLAPGAAAKAMAEVMAFAPMAAAEGGWQLPSFGGPFPALLHVDEKVLPARQSKGIDRIIDAMESGKTGVASGATYNISAMDGADVERVLRRHHRAVRNVWQEYQRTGRGPYEG